MSQTPLIFTQLTQFLPIDFFKRLVREYKGNAYVKGFTCWNHLLVMVWAQLTGRVSLRDIVSSLHAHSDKTFRMGMGKNISRNNLAYANANRELAIYREMAQRMMAQASRIEINDMLLKNLIETYKINGFYAIDSSTVRFSLERFSWSVPQENKGGIKIHTMFDILRNVPRTCYITGHEERDQTFMDDFRYEPGCMYVMDKMYVKTPSLFHINKSGAYFITRIKSNMIYQVLQDRPVDGERVLADKTITFSSRWAAGGYPDPLRLILFYSPQDNKTFAFISNNFDMEPATIALLYAYRWHIELFFKWIKQHLRIKSFYGTSGNAVFIQIYTAIIAYCLLAISANAIKFNGSLYEFASIISVTLTEKAWLRDVLFRYETRYSLENYSSQLLLF